MLELTERDYWLIRRQCEIQSALDELEEFTAAYVCAKAYAHTRSRESVSEEEVEFLTRFLLSVIKPRTRGTWRQVEVVFASGDKALDPELIPGTIKKWFGAFVDGQIEAIDLFEELENIHPGVDGNGRLGHLMWAIYSTWKTGTWPQELPPDVFGALKNRVREYKGAFGSIEV